MYSFWLRNTAAPASAPTNRTITVRRKNGATQPLGEAASPRRNPETNQVQAARNSVRPTKRKVNAEAPMAVSNPPREKVASSKAAAKPSRVISSHLKRVTRRRVRSEAKSHG